MYKQIKIELAEHVLIRKGATVELPVSTFLKMQEDDNVFHDGIYGKFYLRKSLAKLGLLQVVHTPFPSDYNGFPLIVVKNDSIDDLTLRKGDEIGEIWIFK